MLRASSGSLCSCSSSSSDAQPASHRRSPAPRLARCTRQPPAGGENRHSALDSTRRGAIVTLLAGAAGAAWPASAQASKLGATVDRAWEALGGGPADLTFPDMFEGRWTVQSTLVSVDTPRGAEFVPDARSVNRAVSQDLNRTLVYPVAFTRNGAGQVVPDRRFNTAALMELYLGGGVQYAQRIDWAVDDPNVLSLELPGGTSIMTRVTRRSKEAPGPDRIDTSEYVETVFERPEALTPKVKASRCFTKYKFRSAEAAGSGPAIVATQVVSDYLTAFDEPALVMQVGTGAPVVVFTYKMAFFRPGAAGAGAPGA